MRRFAMMTGTCILLAAASIAAAQRPGGGRGDAARPAGGDGFVARMMTFDEDKDGKLSKSEVTDPRLQRLFNRADEDKDGIVTKAELTALAAKEPMFGGGGPGGFGGPPGGGPGGFGPPGGGPGGRMMGFPRPGEILPAMVQQRLKLTPEQRTKLEALQKEVDTKLAAILDDEQKDQLKEMRERGPGGFGPPPGFGRPGGGPGGPPPGGFGPPPGGPDDEGPRPRQER